MKILEILVEHEGKLYRKKGNHWYLLVGKNMNEEQKVGIWTAKLLKELFKEQLDGNSKERIQKV